MIIVDVFSSKMFTKWKHETNTYYKNVSDLFISDDGSGNPVIDTTYLLT